VTKPIKSAVALRAIMAEKERRVAALLATEHNRACLNAALIEIYVRAIEQLEDDAGALSPEEKAVTKASLRGNCASESRNAKTLRKAIKKKCHRV